MFLKAALAGVGALAVNEFAVPALSKFIPQSVAGNAIGARVIQVGGYVGGAWAGLWLAGKFSKSS